jgi:iron(III) transport system permease protein
MTARLRAALRDPWLAAAAVLGALLLGLVVAPQVWLVKASVLGADGRSLTAENLVRFLTAVRYRHALRDSALLAAGATTLALLVAVPLAYVHARYRVPARGLVLTLATMATVSPPFLGAYVWLMLLGWSGPLSRALRAAGIPWDSIMGFDGLLWVTTWGSVGLVFLFAHDAFAAMDPGLEEAALSVGARPARARLGVVLPLATPALTTAAYLVAMAALTDFGTPKIIGGDVQLLPVLVYHDYLSEVRQNPRMAATGSLVMVALSTLLLLLQRSFLARRGYAVAATHAAERSPLSRRRGAAVLLWTAAVLLPVFVPHLGIVVLSLLTWRADVPGLPFTLANYEELLRRSAWPVAVSFLLALLATALAVMLGALLAYLVVRRSHALVSPALGALAMAPYLIPGTVLAVGLIVAFNRPPLVLTGTAAILVLAYVIRKLPYTLKSAEAALYGVHPSLEEAALATGASPAQAFRDVTARLILPGLVSGGTLTFLMTITELSSTILLYSAAWTTMSVVIFQAALGLGGQFGLAASTATFMMASVYLPLYLVRRRFAVTAGLAA